MAIKPRPIRVTFRDAAGKFLPATERYSGKVAMVQVKRNKQWITLANRELPPDDLVQVLNQREFESLPEALVDVKDYKSKSKYKAWDISEQIDRTKRLRRKNLKFTVTIMDGTRRKSIAFYHNIKRNSASSYALFRRINQEIGLEGMFLYDKIGGKLIADRTGKKVSLVGIKVQEIK
jgi:hypothetical protein